MGMYLSVPIQDMTKKDWKIEDRCSCLLVFCVGIRDLFLNPVGSSLKLWFLEIRLRRKDKKANKVMTLRIGTLEWNEDWLAC